MGPEHTEDLVPTGGEDGDTLTTELLLPGVDPFHDAPADLAMLAPGTVIRTRRVRLGFLGLVPQRRLRAWQIAYRSTSLHGEPELAVSTVVVPGGAQRRTPRGLIGYQCAIDAVSDRCFPSYAMRAGARPWGALPQFEVILVAALLARGFAVSIADHEGQAGSFAAPREPGYRVLDGLRAALAVPALGLDPELRMGLIGYSGGGMATSWAVEMAGDYAPELPLVGAVLGSPVGDPGEAFLKLNGGPFAGLPALVVAGLRHVYPGLASIVRTHTDVRGVRRLDALERLTTIGAVLRYAFDDFDSYVDAPLADLLATPEVLEVFEDLRLGKHSPACPVLVLQSTNDQVVDVADVDDQVQRYVDHDGEVLYVRDRISEHISLMVLGFPTMLGWLEDRFRAYDEPAPTGVRTTVSVALSPRSWPGFARMGGALGRTVLGLAG
ncbi:lipase family protein [Nocardioides terrisoli]|uniref:lipase family protein n=1 Tax=Nocardioides terrisoli TaxID=3388267 RepID=UPI00287B72A5|nr:lipase family protein [Nocardioides marmorisolisilvae]